MVIQVVAGQVGEDADIPLDALDALLLQRVRADFHHAGLAIGAEHLGHHLLDFERLGRGALGGNHALADLVAHGADQAALDASRLQYLLDHEGHSGLAVRAGDPNDPELFAGILVVGRRGPGQGFARVRDPDAGHALRTQPVLFADNRRRAALDGAADEVVSVRLLPGYGHKDHAWRHAS